MPQTTLSGVQNSLQEYFYINICTPYCLLEETHHVKMSDKFHASPFLNLIPNFHSRHLLRIALPPQAEQRILQFGVTDSASAFFHSLFHEILRNPYVYKIPWKYFIQVALSFGIKVRIDPTFLKGIKPSVIIKVFAPCVKISAIFVNF